MYLKIKKYARNIISFVFRVIVLTLWINASFFNYYYKKDRYDLQLKQSFLINLRSSAAWSSNG